MAVFESPMDLKIAAPALYNAIKGIYSDLLYGNQPEKINHYVPTKIVLKENLIYG